MRKLKLFFQRVAKGSLKRLFHNLEQVHRESGRSRIVLFFDMLYCMFHYGVGYLEYVTFGFAYKKKDKRKTFVTMNDNVALVRRLNDRAFYEVLDDKLSFNRRFRDFLGRDFVDLQEGFEPFEAFLGGKECFFAKQTKSFGGVGVEKIRVAEHPDHKKLYDELMEKKMFLAEEAIRQHPEMDRLCARSLNTLRIVTILNDRGEARFLYALIRIGNGKTDVDNITSGGMYTLLDPDGSISHPVFCDKTVSYYDVHPENGTVFQGFQVPYFREAVELCQKAAFVEPHMRYVGWDVGITPTGPVLVEGNNLPGYDMAQNHRFHDDGCGMKAVFEDAIHG